MKKLPMIWLIFAVLYTCFSLYHFYQLFYPIPHFQWKSHEFDTEFYSGTASEVKINLTNFITQWNKYVDRQNSSSFVINLITFITCGISAYLAYFSWSDLKDSNLR